MNMHTEVGAIVSPAKTLDFEPIARLAREIWYLHYPGIITVKQIDYMLDQRYRSGIIATQIESGDVWWDTITVGQRLEGFACYERGSDRTSIKLDKLYIHPRVQGHGYGYALVRHAERSSRERGFARMYLQVNKGNSNSIRFYNKAGFSVSDTVTVEIGNGFVMDDFVMSKPIGE